MPIDDTDSFADNIQRWAGGEGQPVGDDASVRGEVSSDFNSLGNVVSDPVDLPNEGSYRSWQFTDPLDLQAYLDKGGLTAYDQNGQPVPNPILWLVAEVDDYGDSVYTLWIEEGS